MRNKLFLLFVSVLILIIPMDIGATNTSYKYGYYDYVIDKYDINIKVNENNTFNITETIDVYFNKYKHGIFRTIPLINTIYRLDGTSSNNKAQISDVEVSDAYTISKNDGEFQIKIGSPDYTLIGKKSYTIKYTYNIGRDPLKEKDELYYNIIGNDWDTIIKSVSFTINMPKYFDKTKLGFSSGIKGSTNNNYVSYNIVGNTIVGNYNNVLEVGEGLTIRMELPEDYFINECYNKNIYLYFLIPSICLLISIFLWYLYGKENYIVETIEFYPPEGYNSLEIGFLYKGVANKKDVTSLLIYLANKGYLKIHNGKYDVSSKKLNLDDKIPENIKLKISEYENKLEQEKEKNPSSPKIRIYENLIAMYRDINKPSNKELSNQKNKFNLLSEDDFVIEKNKKYDGDNNLERIFFDGLFKFDIVTKNDLYNEFYMVMNELLDEVNSKSNKKRIFTSAFSFKFIAVKVMIIVSLLSIIVVPAINCCSSEEILTTFMLVLFYIPFYEFGLSKKTPIPFVFRCLCLGIITLSLFEFLNIPATTKLITLIINDPLYLTGFFLGIVCIAGMVICFNFLPKRNKYGNELLGKIRGFKKFLETAEKNKLEMMVYENPNYFYDILPYAYVLGVSDKWIEKFESLALKSPDWIGINNNFNFTNFGCFVDKTMSSAQKVMSSRKVSLNNGLSSRGFSNDSLSNRDSSGRRSSGGGSSGGGSGGGGGGSW